MSARDRSQRLLLLGGGPGAMLSLRRHFKSLVAELGQTKPLVAYVGVASNDNAGFQRMIAAELAFTGATFRMAKLAAKAAKVAEAEQLLQDADLVFVSGGDVDHGMNVLKDRGVLDLFRRLCAEGKPMFGISAGSVMLAKAWVRFPDDDDARAEPFECIGAVSFHVDAHSEDDDWAELRTLLGLLHKRGESEPVGYGLTVKGGLSVVVENGEARFRAVGTDIPKLVVRAGKVVHARPVALGQGE